MRIFLHHIDSKKDKLLLYERARNKHSAGVEGWPNTQLLTHTHTHKRPFILAAIIWCTFCVTAVGQARIATTCWRTMSKRCLPRINSMIQNRFAMFYSCLFRLDYERWVFCIVALLQWILTETRHSELSIWKCGCVPIFATSWNERAKKKNKQTYYSEQFKQMTMIMNSNRTIGRRWIEHRANSIVHQWTNEHKVKFIVNIEWKNKMEVILFDRVFIHIANLCMPQRLRF